jgi:AbiU2
VTKTAEAAFEQELEIFRTEEETAQQHFFAYLSVREFAVSNHDVVKAMNTTPLFWLTTHHAMLLSAFIWLGRIFDQNSGHNIDRLMTAASKDLAVFTKSALAKRKQTAGLSINEAATFVSDAFEPMANDFRALRKEIKAQRTIYEARYQTFATKCSLTTRSSISPRQTSFSRTHASTRGDYWWRPRH